MASVIVMRWAGSSFQHPLIIFHARSESSGWPGRAGRRPFNIEYTPPTLPSSENGARPAKT